MAGSRRTRGVNARSLQSFDETAPPPPAEPVEAPGDPAETPAAPRSPARPLPPLEPESNRSLEERQVKWLLERERVQRLRRESGVAKE
jgi:hypothetical protein